MQTMPPLIQSSDPSRSLLHRLETSLEGSVDIANLKRESKAYSYEDQKWEAEMRLEMLKKKKAKAGGQKEEEKDIRIMMKQANLSQKRKVCQRLFNGD